MLLHVFKECHILSLSLIHICLAKINLDDFQGAEADCDKAIERNPFVVGAYQIRGLARIRQNKYDGAIEDYQKALFYAPENVTCLLYTSCFIRLRMNVLA